MKFSYTIEHFYGKIVVVIQKLGFLPVEGRCLMKITHEINDCDLVAHVLKLNKGTSEFHWHEKYEICQLLDNDCDFLVDSEEIHAKKGDLITINEYDFHIFKPLHDGTHFRIIQFLPKIIMPSLQSHKQLKTHISAEDMDQIPGFREQIDTLYLWMEKECADDRSGSSELSRLYARTIYMLLERNFTATELKPKADRKEFHKIVEYVNAHFTENINITSISKKLYVSRSRVSSIFLKFSGIPLTEYINILRIEYVNKLLRDGTDVMSAAYESGFSSIRTFNSVYKRIMKVTPTQYIKDEM